MRLIYLLSPWHALSSSGSAKTRVESLCYCHQSDSSLLSSGGNVYSRWENIWITILSAYHCLVKQEQNKLKNPSWCMPLKHLEVDLSPLLTRKVFFSFCLSSEILCKYPQTGRHWGCALITLLSWVVLISDFIFYT